MRKLYSRAWLLLWPEMIMWRNQFKHLIQLAIMASESEIMVSRRSHAEMNSNIISEELYLREVLVMIGDTID